MPAARVARAHRGAQPLEVLLAELGDIIGAGIDPALEPIPVAALFHLAARRMEDHDGTRQHAPNALVDGAAVSRVVRSEPR